MRLRAQPAGARTRAAPARGAARPSAAAAGTIPPIRIRARGEGAAGLARARPCKTFTCSAPRACVDKQFGFAVILLLAGFALFQAGGDGDVFLAGLGSGTIAIACVWVLIRIVKDLKRR